MKNIAVKLIHYFNDKEDLEEERYVVYLYGLSVLMEILLSVVITLVIAGTFRLIKEMMVIYIVTFIIRSFGGGFHFKKFYKCLVLSVSFMLSILFIYQYIDISLQLLLICFNGAVIYLFIRGVSKNQFREYNNREERYYNLLLRIIVIYLGIMVNVFMIVGWYDFFKLLAITVSMLSLIKLAGDIQYFRHISAKEVDS